MSDEADNKRISELLTERWILIQAIKAMLKTTGCALHWNGETSKSLVIMKVALARVGEKAECIVCDSH